MEDLFVLAIVDDEPGITNSLEREIRLEFGSGVFDIVTFNNPLEALPWIVEHKDTVFLVIADLRMPEMNGSEFLERLRAQTRDVQTILLTAFTDMDSIQRAVSASIMSLMFKPWKREHLVVEIDRALRLRKLSRENEQLRNRIDGMLRSAGDFQQSLFSLGIPTNDHVDISISFNPLDEYHCGGDFYDIYDIGGDRLLVLLGDVTGHGPKPMAIACMIKVVLKTVLDENPELYMSPDRLLSALNDRFCALFSNSPDILIALAAACIDIKKRTLSLATAGIPPVLQVRQGVPEALSTPNPVPGAFPDSKYYKTERVILPGDRIIMFTDGLAESAPTFFALGESGVLELCANRKDYSAEALRSAFVKILPEGRFTDDVTIISMEIGR